MKYLNGKNYTELNDREYIIHPIEKKIIRERTEPKNLKTQNYVRGESKNRENQS